MTWRNSSNHVILLFPPLAGGKFISYCLAHSNNAIPWFDIVNNKDVKKHLETKLRLIADIIPQSVTSNWPELRPPLFWGFQTNQHLQFKHHRHDHKIDNWGTIDQMVPAETLMLLETYRCFSVLHNASYDEIMSVFPECKILQLYNTNVFRSLASQIKHHHVLDREQNYKRITTHDNVFYFDIDNTIFNWDTFVAKINEAAEFLNLEAFSDYQYNHMHAMYQKYIKLHM